EDGIRDFHVTGVQTCALPIFLRARRSASEAQDVQVQIFTMGRAFSAVPGVATGRRVLNLPRGRPPLLRSGHVLFPQIFTMGRKRSEERRVGKDGGSGGALDHV